jgi:hypothetical protein
VTSSPFYNIKISRLINVTFLSTNYSFPLGVTDRFKNRPAINY